MCKLENSLNYNFKVKDHLYQALTHKSFAIEHGLNTNCNYERLEFLGDTVVNLIVSNFLFSEFVEYTEGNLSKLKSFFVSSHFLYTIALKLQLNEFVLIGSNERINSYNKNPDLMCDVFEALIGALYLDGAIAVAEEIILNNIKDYLNENYINLDILDYKSLLQKYSTKKFKCLPVYRLIKELGPDHEKTYLIEVRLPMNYVAEGKGKRKKIAEKMAAKHLLDKLHINAL